MANELEEQGGIDKDFSERIRHLVKKLGGIKNLSSSANVSEGVIKNYLSGQSDPTRKKLIALADAGAVNIEWLATGRGSAERLDIDLFKAIIIATEECLEEANLKLSNNKKAELVVLVFESINGKDCSHEDIKQAIRKLIHFSECK